MLMIGISFSWRQILPNYQEFISRKKVAILNDDYFGIQPSSVHTFFDVEKSIVDVAYVSYEYVGIGLMLGPNKITYTRNVFTLMQLIGNVGGVYGLLISV